MIPYSNSTRTWWRRIASLKKSILIWNTSIARRRRSIKNKSARRSNKKWASILNNFTMVSRRELLEMSSKERLINWLNRSRDSARLLHLSSSTSKIWRKAQNIQHSIVVLTEAPFQIDTASKTSIFWNLLTSCRLKYMIKSWCLRKSNKSWYLLAKDNGKCLRMNIMALWRISYNLNKKWQCVETTNSWEETIETVLMSDAKKYSILVGLWPKVPVLDYDQLLTFQKQYYIITWTYEPGSWLLSSW